MPLGGNVAPNALKEPVTTATAAVAPGNTAMELNAVTPLPLRNLNATGNPMVTTEKCTAVASDLATNKKAIDDIVHENASPITVSVVCPDGSTIQLFSADDGSNNSSLSPSRLIIGRGKHGISSSAVHVSRQACMLRLVDRSYEADGGANHCGTPTTSSFNSNDKQYSLEIIALGSQPCRVTRSASVVFLKSISNIISSRNNYDDLSPSSVTLRNGDVIEPYGRPLDCTIEEAETQGVYHPFKVSIINCNLEGRADEMIDGAAFVEASRKIDKAVQTESAIHEEGKSYESCTVSTQTAVAFASIGSKETGNKKDESKLVASMEHLEETQDLAQSIGIHTTTSSENTIHTTSSVTNEQNEKNTPHNVVEASRKVDKASQTDGDFNTEGKSHEACTVSMRIAVTSARIVSAETNDGNNDSTLDTSNEHLEKAQDFSRSFGMQTAVKAAVAKGPQDVVCENAMPEKSFVMNEQYEKHNNNNNLDVEMENRVYGSNVADKLESTLKENLYAQMPKEAEQRGEKVPIDVTNVVIDSSKPTERSEGNSEATVANEEANVSTKTVDLEMKESVKPADELTIPDDKPKEDVPSSATEESSEEEYEDMGDPRQEIIDILQDVQSPGTFAIGGSCEGKLIMPGLEVDGCGPIGLPLSESQAKELAKRCEQAPFGRGSKTIVDKTVRNTFQLAPEHFQVTNPGWNKEMKNLTEQVCKGLGVEADLKVEARIYKLLLYEEGSFFVPHRDSEKEEGMFGTLVVVLPSHFSGGELAVKHKGDTETFQQGASSKFASQYAAFYADCRHELKKVTSGHRLCLVYNLVKVGFGLRPTAADNCAVLKKLKVAARLWSDEYSDDKVVFMTDHQYTPSGINNGKGSAKYKGSDAAIVQLIELAIEKGVDLDYDHGTVSFSETGDAEADGYCYYDGGSYSWNETIDSDLSLDLSTWGSASINEEELIPEDYFEDQEPKNETFEPTGNEGVNAERQYADAEAIVVWPRSQRWKLVTHGDPSRMCEYLIKACKEGTPDYEPREECIKKANAIISSVKDGRSPSNVAKLMRCIVMIGDNQLGKNFLSSYLSANPTKTPDAIMDQVQSFIDQFGADVINPTFLPSINATRFSADPTGTANFLIKYCKTIGIKESNSQLTENLIRAFVDLICPPHEAGRRVPSKSVESFPLNAILGLFLCGDKHSNSMAQAKRVLQGYIWLSCQHISESVGYHFHSHRAVARKGPQLLLTAAPSLVDLCDKFGWKKNESVLVEATEKLCLYGKTENAIDLVNKIAPTTPSSGGICERSLICSRMASIACQKAVNAAQFTADPTGTANFLIKYRNTIAMKIRDPHLTENIIGAFVDSMCPPDKASRHIPSKNVDSFPLDAILRLFVGDEHKNSGILVKRILEGYVWLSCQRIAESSGYQSYSHRDVTPKGPHLLLMAAHSLVSLCHKFGWKEHEGVLIGSAEKLCMYGNADNALALVEKLAPSTSSSGGTCERSLICSRMASIACGKILGSSQRPTTLAAYKKLVKIIGNYCPSFAPRFIALAEHLDVDSILYPLVTDSIFRSAANDSTKSFLNTLTNCCAQILHSDASIDLGSIVVWVIPTTNRQFSLNNVYSSFLKCPCRKVYDWQVRKSDHRGFLADLGPLIRMGEVKAESYQPRGRGPYHFKITKLKPRRVPVASMGGLSCSCSTSSSSRYPSYRSHQQPTASQNCILKQHRAALSKRRDDEKKIGVVKAFLSPEQQSKLGSRKRPANHSPTNAGRTNPVSVSAAPACAGRIIPFSKNTDTACAGPYSLAIRSGVQGQLHSQHAAKKQKTTPEVVNLLDDDDDICIEGVLGPEEAIAKRRKEAEDRGEIVEIS